MFTWMIVFYLYYVAIVGYLTVGAIKDWTSLKNGNNPGYRFITYFLFGFAQEAFSTFLESYYNFEAIYITIIRVLAVVYLVYALYLFVRYCSSSDAS